MTVHFITASRGGDEPHVTSGDDARQNVAHIGNVNYVGKTGDQLSASMTSSNTLRILSGDGWICGRHWAVDGFEDVTIENGNPGYNRKDLVVFHAETSPSDNGYITVIKGEETTGDAVVPTYTEGDLNEGDTVAEMPLYVVSLTGVSVGDPEPQFDVLLPYNEFRTSIDQYRHYTTNSSSFVPVCDLSSDDNFVILGTGNAGNDRIISSVIVPADFFISNNNGASKTLIANYSADSATVAQAYYSDGKVYANIANAQYFKAHIFIY